MSSIRLYILGSLAERGPMHGHALVALAEEEHIDQWTEISVGGLYGAMKRMADEGAVEVVRTERHGNYPERQVYGITDAGRQQLRDLRDSTLDELVWRHDPVDLALTRLDPERLDELGPALTSRRDRLVQILADHQGHLERIRQYLTYTEQLAMTHGEHRIRAEILWHDDLLLHLDEILRDERSRQKEPPRD